CRMLEKNITIVNQVEQLEELAGILETVSEEWDIPMKVSLNLNLVLEELITNIIFYGYDDTNEHLIYIRLYKKDNEIEIQIEDDGKEFNPLLVAEPDIDESIENRKIGGLGIHFVRKIMDSMNYRRSDGKNILTLTKNIA
ncbi:MAG TPA: ATP-binding protein, partial [Bacteroidales bacterium]|nr:ATP-binding protein [Bacteroidales bacterium]